MLQLPIKSFAAAALLTLGTTSSMALAVVTPVPGVALTVDGQTIFVEAKRTIDARQKVVYIIEGYSNPESGIQSIDTFMDPDPVITAATSMLDFGAASNFNFLWSLPIVPTVGPVTLKLTLGGSCTDNDRNGCSATPNLASGFLADGLLDGLVKVSGGSVFSGPAGGSGSFASTIFTVNLPAGPYSNLGLNLGFLGSGGGDAFSYTLGVEVVNATVAEPASLALAALAFGAAGLASRRRKAA
jgi:hypothetical protein